MPLKQLWFTEMEAPDSIKLVSLKTLMLEKHQKVKGRPAKSEQLHSKLPQSFSPSVINSYPEAFPVPSLSHAYQCRCLLVYQPRTLASSLDLSHFWWSENVRDPFGKGLWAFSYHCFIHVLSQAPGGISCWQGRCSGGTPKASCGVRRTDAGVSSTLGQCWGMAWWGMLMGDRGGEAAAVEHVTDMW